MVYFKSWLYIEYTNVYFNNNIDLNNNNNNIDDNNNEDNTWKPSIFHSRKSHLRSFGIG